MKIDHCLILAAGMGTRMGEIGKTLPKILWPVYEKSLLELQILYAKSLGCKKIYINSHFQHKFVEEELKKLRVSDVELVHEPELLRVGGAVHNIARKKEISYRGNLLILNGDQFYFFDVKHFLSTISEEASVVLAGIIVKNNDYNALIINDGYLKSIEKTKEKFFTTYSGVSVVNLAKIHPTEGASDFFSSVANFKKEKIKVYSPESSEYWDFGTVDRYYRSIYDVPGKKDSYLGDFLTKMSAFNELSYDLKLNSYNSNNKDCINLTSLDKNLKSDCLQGKIIIGAEIAKQIALGDGILYNEMFEKINQ